MNYPSSFFVVINEQGQIVHSSTDPDNAPLMKRYVQMAKSAGDSWELLEYVFSHVVPCSNEDNET